ncbi:MAG: cellulose synthase [Actinobacteria bacterium]|nr:cellulose synthase [Actinomycetota bacterium]
MSTYNSIAWLPLCAGLTGIGLVISWFVFRRRGFGSGLRTVAWSLLPLAAYLTGSIEMFWKIGTAIGNFAAHLVLSPKVWSGVGVAALAAVLFVVSGPAKRRRRRRRGQPDAADEAAATSPGAQRPAVPEKAAANGAGRKQLEPTPSRAAKSAKSPEPDDDMREIEEILRRRGIN